MNTERMIRMDVTLWADGTIAAHAHATEDGSDEPRALYTSDWSMQTEQDGFTVRIRLHAPA